MKRESSDNRVRLYPDGKYRWVYEVPMLRNPSIAIDVGRVLCISIGVVWLFMVVLLGFEDGFSLHGLWSVTRVFLLLMLAFLAIGALAYLIVAWAYGWKYTALFTMDEQEIVHQQAYGQTRRAQMLGALSALAGAAAGRAGAVGAGLLSASHFSTTSRYADGGKVVPRRSMHLIKVDQRLSRNRIYVDDEDFDFVYDFLSEHCSRHKCQTPLALDNKADEGNALK